MQDRTDAQIVLDKSHALIDTLKLTFKAYMVLLNELEKLDDTEADQRSLMLYLKLEYGELIGEKDKEE